MAWREGSGVPLTPLFYPCAFVVAASLVLGGATRPGYFSDFVVQLAAIPLLLLSIWRLFETPLSQQARTALLLCFGILAIPILQLIPLPPDIWTALPKRDLLIESYKLIDQELPWRPVSVSPQLTWA